MTQAPGALVTFSSCLLSPVQSRWLLLLQSDDSALSFIHLLLSPPTELYILITVFLSSKISIWLFSIFSISCRDSIFPFGSNVFVIARQSVFLMTLLKSLSDYSNISFFLAFACFFFFFHLIWNLSGMTGSFDKS